MKTITLTVNGEKITAAVEPRTHLGDFLRNHLQLTGTHLGCEHGVCGACTVLIDGAPARSCINYAVACDGQEITTVEGFGDDVLMNRLRRAFNDNHALQCGFCTPGQLVSARDLLVRLDDPDEARIRKEMSANLCRCTGYMGIVNSVIEVFADKDPALLQARKQEANPSTLNERVGLAAPASTAATIPETAASAASFSTSGEGWTEISQTLALAHPADEVWQRLQDYHLVARCLPGAAIDTIEGDNTPAASAPPWAPSRPRSAAMQPSNGATPTARVGYAGRAAKNPGRPRPRANSPMPSARWALAARSSCRSNTRSRAAWHNSRVLALWWISWNA